MKKIAFNLIILLSFLSSLAQQNSENGFTIPVKGPIKVLLVYAEITANFSANSSVTGYGKGALPSGSDQMNPANLFDAAYVGTEPSNYFSKYFFQQSFGQYIVLGDYIDHVIQFPNAPSSDFFGYQTVYNYISALHAQGQFQNSLASNSDPVEFDKYTCTNQALTYAGKLKSPTPNNRADAIIILWKNHPRYKYGGHGLVPEWGFRDVGVGPFTDGIESAAGFPIHLGREFILSEYFHAMFGRNYWHSGSGAGHHTFLTQTNPWGIPTQSAGAGISIVSNGWDRNHLGWKGWKDINQTVQKDNLISALDQSGNEVNTDFKISSSIGNGYYILRDFVKYGDAIRILLPHIKNDPSHANAQNQYLWVENHQKLTQFDVGLYDEFSCKDSITSGLWGYIQVGKDNKDIGDIFLETAGTPNGSASWIFPLTAEGNYDFSYSNQGEDTNWNECVWQNKYIALDKANPNTKPNTFTGFSDLFNYYNSNNDNLLYNGDDYQPNFAEMVDGNLVFNSHNRGDRNTAFNFNTGKRKLSISSNPATTPVYTYRSGDDLKFTQENSEQHKEVYENRTIWLNGISVEILSENYQPSAFGDGAILVKVRFDDYDVTQDARWCGQIKLSPNDFDPTPSDFSDLKYSLNIHPNVTIEIDKGKSYTRHYAIDQEPITNTWNFSEYTDFTMLPNSYLHMENNSAIIVDGNSTFRVSPNSKLEVHEYSKITVKKGSKLIIEQGGLLALHDNAFIRIEEGGTFEYNNSDIFLSGDNSYLDFAGNLVLAANSEFKFRGDGFIKFSSTAFTTNNSNLISGANSKIILVGTSPNDKVLEITQETLMASSPLSSFTIENGQIELGNNSRLCVATNLIINNSNFTKTSAASSHSHRGLNIYGQDNITITNSTFQQGKYGIFSIETYGGNTLTLGNCKFIGNLYGLVTIDKGVKLYNCEFTANELGWEANGMTFPCKTLDGEATENFEAYKFNSSGSGYLYLIKPNIHYNDYRGVEFNGGNSLIVTCGAITNNNFSGYSLSSGILLTNNGTLNIAKNIKPGAGNVNISNNKIAILTECGNRLLMNQGYNDLASINRVIEGDLSGYGYTQQILAQNNKWKSALTPPVINTNYFLKRCGAQKQITISDPQPTGPSATCGIPFDPNLRVKDPLENCVNCDKYTTPSFNDISLNDAIKIAMSEISYDTEQDDKKAISLIHELLTCNYSKSRKSKKFSDDELWLIELAYEKAKESFGNGLSNNQISLNSYSESFNKLIAIQDSLKELTYFSSSDHKLFYLDMDKAGLFKAVNERDKALQIIEEVDKCYTLDTTQNKFLQFQKFIIQSEKLASNGKLQKGDFMLYFETNRNKIISASQMEHTEVEKGYAKNTYFVEEPIPFKSKITGNSQLWEFGDCSTSVASEPIHSFQTEGKYSVKLSQNFRCGVDEKIEEVKILPRFKVKPEATKLNSDCKREKISISREMISESLNQPCSSGNRQQLNNAELRLKLSWDFSSVAHQDFSEYVELNNLNINPMELYLNRGDSVNINLKTEVEILEESEWKKTNYIYEEAVSVYSDNEMTAEISIEGSICKDRSLKFHSTIEGGEEPYTYHWDFKDGNYSTLESPQKTYTECGIYSFKPTIKDKEGCIAKVKLMEANQNGAGSHSHGEGEFSGELLIGIPLCDTDSSERGSEDTEVQSPISIEVYPNPNSENRIYIESRTAFKHVGYFEIYDLTGKLLISQKVSGYKSEVNLGSEFPSGIYFYLLKSELDSSILKKEKLILIKK